MTFVYRVENSQGQGMYTGDRFNLNECPEYQEFRYACDVDEKVHPMPSHYLLNKSGMGRRFAFESIQALYTWLYEKSWIKYLRENGFHIKKYFADEIYKDDERQLVFGTSQDPVAQYALSIYGPAK